MSLRSRYDFYASPQHSGVRPRELRQLLDSRCMLRSSLRSLERWCLELYDIREGWMPLGGYWEGWNWSYEEIGEEMRECNEIYERRIEAFASVTHALTNGARPRRD